MNKKRMFFDIPMIILALVVLVSAIASCAPPTEAPQFGASIQQIPQIQSWTNPANGDVCYYTNTNPSFLSCVAHPR